MDVKRFASFAGTFAFLTSRIQKGSPMDKNIRGLLLTVLACAALYAGVSAYNAWASYTLQRYQMTLYWNLAKERHEQPAAPQYLIPQGNTQNQQATTNCYSEPGQRVICY